MDKALSFFRVFDLALFLPGLVLYALLRSYPGLGAFDPLAGIGEMSAAAGVLAAIAVVAVAYGLGLTVHALQRLLLQRVRWIRRTLQPNWCPAPAWHADLAAGPRAELLSYFWYMRATCWNLALALAIAAVVLLLRAPAAWPQADTLGAGECGLALLVGALLLLYLGCDFDRALNRRAC